MSCDTCYINRSRRGEKPVFSFIIYHSLTISSWVSKQAHWPIMRNRLLPWGCRRGMGLSMRACVRVSVCLSAPEREEWESKMEKTCWGAPGPSRQGALHLVPGCSGAGGPPPNTAPAGCCLLDPEGCLGIECAGWRRSQNRRDCVGGRGCERYKPSVGLRA